MITNDEAEYIGQPLIEVLLYLTNKLSVKDFEFVLNQMFEARTRLRNMVSSDVS